MAERDGTEGVVPSARRTLASADLGPPAAPDLARTALFVDLDGTLAPIRPRPDDVGPDGERARILSRLNQGLGGALAVISGRTLPELDRILGGEVTALAAIHGLVRREPDGRVVQAHGDAIAGGVLAALEDLKQSHPQLLIENKGPSVALHYRAAPGLGPICLSVARELAASAGLALQAGDMVVELRAPGPTKAGAVACFMGEPPFAGRTPIFVGDDLTDEDGFAGAERFGGYGVIVGPRRPTRARKALADVGAVLAWLSAAADG